MNINKKNLEILLIGYLAQKIKYGKTKTGETYFSELLLDLVEDKKLIKVHFIYHTETTALLSGGWNEVIEFTLSYKTEQTREYLQKLENETYVDKNGLYTIIETLKEL